MRRHINIDSIILSIFEPIESAPLALAAVASEILDVSFDH